MAGVLSRSGGGAAGEVARRDADDSLMRRLRKGRASTSIIAGESAPPFCVRTAGRVGTGETAVASCFFTAKGVPSMIPITTCKFSASSTITPVSCVHVQNLRPHHVALQLTSFYFHLLHMMVTRDYGMLLDRVQNDNQCSGGTLGFCLDSATKE